MKKTISISQYNALFHIAENLLQKSWRDLGLTEQEVIERSEKNLELQKIATKNGTSPVYELYKTNANAIVNQILEQLSVETSDASSGCKHTNIAEPSKKALKGGYASSKCADCNTSFGWYCETSPDKGCHYFSEERDGKRVVLLNNYQEVEVVSKHPEHETDDSCLFCGQPDERK